MPRLRVPAVALTVAVAAPLILTASPAAAVEVDRDTFTQQLSAAAAPFAEAMTDKAIKVISDQSVSGDASQKSTSTIIINPDYSGTMTTTQGGKSKRMVCTSASSCWTKMSNSQGWTKSRTTLKGMRDVTNFELSSVGAEDVTFDVTDGVYTLTSGPLSATFTVSPDRLYGSAGYSADGTTFTSTSTITIVDPITVKRPKK